MKTLSIAFLVAVTVLPSLAQQPAAPAAEPASTGSTAPSRYQLKARSGFNVPAGSRAPFIPIGWAKKDGAQLVIITEDKIDESAFRVTSILLGNPTLAVINGQSYEEGQFLRMPRGAPPVRIRVFRITDGQVWLQHGEKLFARPLNRMQLGERAVEEQLLNAERYVVPMPVPSATPAPAPAPMLKP